MYFWLKIFLIFVINFSILEQSSANQVRFSHLEGFEKVPKTRVKSIVQDSQGFIWLSTGSDFYRFDGLNLKPFKSIFSIDIIEKLPLKEISKLYFSKNNDLWIATKLSGLYKISNNTLTSYRNSTENKNSINSNTITATLESHDKGLWVGTKLGLSYIAVNNKITHFPIALPNIGNKDKYITSVVYSSKDDLLIGTMAGLFSFSTTSYKFKKIPISENDKEILIYTLFKDSENTIWIGTNEGLYKRKVTDGLFVKYKPSLIQSSILSINISQNNIWIGTMLDGLIKISRIDESVTVYTHSPEKNNSVSGNSITSLVLDNSGILWISSFNGEMRYLDTNKLNFGLNFSSSGSKKLCNKSSIIYDVAKNKNTLWLATEKEVIKYNEQTHHCESYSLKGKNPDIPFVTYSVDIDDYQQIWLSTSNGLKKINDKKKEISNQTLFNEVTFFSVQYTKDKRLLGTDHGLYLYDIKNQKKLAITNTNGQIINTKFYSFIKDTNLNYYFATSGGLFYLNENAKLKLKAKIQSKLPTQNITSIHVNGNDLWIGTYLHGLYHFKDNKLVKQYTETDGIPENLSIQSIQADKLSNLWLGTDVGLLRLNLKTKTAHTFSLRDGLQSNYFLRASTHKAEDGKLYFGGRNGFNAFYPEDIKTNKTPPKIVLTDFTRFGKSVQTGVEKDGFLLKKAINQLNEITLSHKDYVIGFEFAALDYADPSRNQYAYMMEGLDPEWIHTDAANRRISYSNLSSGHYLFRVKASNKDGIWNNEGKSLKIIVKPAPWFSWWAYSLYVLTFFTLLTWYINRKNRVNKKITKMLRIEVAKQTQEIKGQKLKVENLLAQKNELFANVSHEFRTPLTLILGPINKLLNTNLPHSSINDLKMVNRNANRLLTMIEQLLQLAKVSSEAKPQFLPFKTNTHVSSIVASFQPLAQQKRIKLLLEKNDESAISTTADALEIVLGNLLSNAIKYTQSGGKVVVVSKIVENKIQISVKDTGSGLDQQQQKNIFNRFERLDYHQNIQGIGIGLSVVESLLAVNNGNIDITSEPGQGSTFTVSFDIIKLDFEESVENSNSLLLSQLTTEETEANIVRINQKSSHNRQKESVLIIEDNHDMRNHIEDTLKDTYHCLQADRGIAGIALAIKYVPDIIICDVMMPEMDGFQVSRVIRSDTRTSHIPLLLLTALHDRESRIKGWREHVDVYLTKPFDAQELLLQLENILVIRSILKTKAGKSIEAGKGVENSDLPKKDQQFINKLNQLIKENYKNSLYLRANLASGMAVSERQLLRKLKALINKSPIDLLREYRLSQAAIMLKDGYQVSITSDECGFNSLPHFSQCFKSQYGLSPKAYQKSCK